MASQWCYQIMGDAFGPFRSRTIRKLVSNGTISRDTLLRRCGSDRWILADRIRGLFEEVAPNPPAPASQSMAADLAMRKSMQAKQPQIETVETQRPEVSRATWVISSCSVAAVMVWLAFALHTPAAPDATGRLTDVSSTSETEPVVVANATLIQDTSLLKFQDEPNRELAFADADTVAFSPDGTKFVAAGTNSQEEPVLRMWSTDGWKKVREVVLQQKAGKLEFTRYQKTLVASSGEDDVVMSHERRHARSSKRAESRWSCHLMGSLQRGPVTGSGFS